MHTLIARYAAAVGIAVFTTVAYLCHAVFTQPLLGWIAFVLAVGCLGIAPRQVSRYLALMVLAVGCMLLTPVGTKTDALSMALMGGGMALAIAIPYVISHLVYKDALIHFKLDFRRKWRPIEVGAVVFSVLSAYIFMPLYFATTSGAGHWQMGDAMQISIVFLSIMLIGMWEEFFFVATNFSIMQRYMPFWTANIVQAAMFAGFLYQIGFQDWIAVNTFLYALYQGYVFHKFKFLLLNVTIHAIVDLIVFLALYNAIFPGSVPIFLPLG